MKKVFFLLFICFVFSANAQTRRDSLWQLYQTEKNDSLRLQALQDVFSELIYYKLDSAFKISVLLLDEASHISNKDNGQNLGRRFQGTAYMNMGTVFYYKGVVDSTVFYFEKAIEFYEESGFEIGVSKAYNNLGLINESLGELDDALSYFEKSLSIKKKLKDKKGIGNSLFNIGLVYDDRGNYPKALEYYLKAKKISEDLDDKKNIAYSYVNLGNIENKRNNIDKALAYFLKGLELSKELNDPIGMGDYYFSLAGIYNSKERFKEALEYYYLSLKYYKQTENLKRIGLTYLNFGSIYNGLGKVPIDTVYKYLSKEKFPTIDAVLDSAVIYLNQGLKISKSRQDSYQELFAYSGFGMNHNLRGNYKKAISFYKKAITIAKEKQFLFEYKMIAEYLYTVYKAVGDTKQTLYWFEEYIKAKDSIYNEENTESFLQKEFEYEYDKQKLADSLVFANEKNEMIAQKKRDDLVSQAEKKSKNLVIIAVSIGLFLVLLFLVVVFNRFRITKRQNAIIHEQKLVVEEKNKEILDSINYAKRIQVAILPPEKMIKELLPKSFIFYQPKDIVAGDFYWLEKVNDLIIFAAADCTGHGVPGAMVSVICHNALNRSVREFSLIEPGEILDKTRELVIEQFEKSEEDVKDGMDIALCVLTPSTKELKYAGANNPLWLIRNKAEVLEEIKGDKQPIGKYAENNPFTTHKILLEKDDLIYIFTDGFADQFGGPRGKKFKYKAFKELLLKNRNFELEKQNSIFEKSFYDWMGDVEQLDDVCLIGVRV